MKDNSFDIQELLKIGIRAKKDLDIIPVYFAKVFNSDDGKKVLGYLISMTMNRCLPPTSTDAELRFLEGERFIVSFIQNIIKKGIENHS